MIRAALMLAILLGLQNALNRLPFKPVMLCGLGIYAVSHLLLIFCPAQNLPVLFGYVVAEALANALVMPRKDSMSIWFVDEKQRARMNALIYVTMIGLTSPFARIIGELSAIDRRLPFVFNIAIFLVCAVMIATSRTLGAAVAEKTEE